MQFTAEIINVGPKTTVGSGQRAYQVVEVAYKRDGKVEGKKLVSFNSKAVFDYVASLTGGVTILVTTEKDDKGYWQWTAVESAEGQVGASSPKPTPKAMEAAKAPSSGRVVGSNYETAEERAKRQIYIVRQSSISAAIEIAKHNNPKGQVVLEAVLDDAQVIENFVFRTNKEQAQKALEEMPDDIPV